MVASSEPFAGEAVEDKKGEDAEADRQHQNVGHCTVPCRPRDSAGSSALHRAVFRSVKLSGTAYVFESSGVRVS
jgi:hypothetical protein